MSDDSDDAEQKQHKVDKKILLLHARTGNTEDGACLTKHVGGVTRSSCSYRWQAIQRAMGPDSTYYNGKRPGWDVNESRFRKANPPGAPYAHQAHHLLPRNVLDEAMLTTAEASESTLLAIILRMGLLEAKYNLNHKDNMMILPVDVRDSRVLELPTHLGSHPNYDAVVTSKVQPVIDEYAKLLEKAAEKPGKHPAPPDKLSRAKLVRVSAQMRAMVFTWARGTGGTRLEKQAPLPKPPGAKA
jgi:hypothetical protein